MVLGHILRRALLAACLLSIEAMSAQAEDLRTQGPMRWIVVSSKQDLSEAIRIASNYSRQATPVRVVQSFNGWYAVVLGPSPVQSIDDVRTALHVPADAYFSRGDRFVATLWQPPALNGSLQADAAAAPRDVPKRPAPKSSSTGTGFYVGQSQLVSNAHVVDGCRDVTIVRAGRQSEGSVLARDETNDLALIEAEAPNEAPARLRAGARLGEDIAVFGFPLNGLLATNGNFTRGSITATAGLGDDSRHLQISAPVQPGNSGGPLLDESGNVVGVIVSKIDAMRLASVTDDIAQNVNFAIRASVLQAFLEANNVPFEVGALSETLRPADLADKGQEMSVVIRCTW